MSIRVSLFVVFLKTVTHGSRGFPEIGQKLVVSLEEGGVWGLVQGSGGGGFPVENEG